MRGLEVLVDALGANLDWSLDSGQLPEPLGRRRIGLELDGDLLRMTLLQPVEGLHLWLGLRLDCK